MTNLCLEAGATGITMRQALERTAGLLEAGAVRLESCQAAMGHFLPAQISPATSEALQGLDATTQIVRELSLVVSRLARIPTDGGVNEALADVRLAALRAALMGESDGGTAPQRVELW